MAFLPILGGGTVGALLISSATASPRPIFSRKSSSKPKMELLLLLLAAGRCIFLMKEFSAEGGRLISLFLIVMDPVLLNERLGILLLNKSGAPGPLGALSTALIEASFEGNSLRLL